MLNFSNLRSRWFLPILEDAGLKKIKPYVLRHTFASMQIKKGVDAPTLAKWMGHTDSGFTLKYYVKAFERSGQITGYTLDELLGDAPPEEETLFATPSPSETGDTVIEVRLTPAQREAFIRGEALTLKLAAN